MSQLNDISLIAQVVMFGNNRAFDQLVKKYQSPIRRFFLHQTCGDGPLSDDLAQDTFIKAYTSLSSFKNLSNFSTWLFRIAINESLNHLNKKRPAVSLEGAEGNAAASLASDSYFDGDNLQQQFQTAISTLPEKQRIVFNLKYFNEMKYEDMSTLLGTSVGALKASYHHAVKKIYSFFEDKD